MRWRLPGIGWRRRWAALRREILERDGWRCVQCGRAGRLEVDHAIPLHKQGDPWAKSNLQTLCRSCHLAKTAKENRERHAPTGERGALRALVTEMIG